MKLTALVVLVSILSLSTSTAFAQDASDWHAVARAIPLGSRVKVRTADGISVSGTLMRVEDTSIVVKRHARVPEPALTVSLDRVTNLEREHVGGLSWGKAIGIGLGAGVGAIVTILVIALQID